MVEALHKTSRSILNLIAWPLLIVAIIMSGIAWNGASWELTDPITGIVNMNGVVFIIGCSLLGLKIVSVFIPPLKKVSQILFSIASCIIIGFLAYSFALQFQTNYHWTFEYSGPNREASMFWGFGFVALIVVMGVYLLTGLIWLVSFTKKDK